MSEWQPIETAPKNGNAILVYSAVDGAVCVANWMDYSAEFGEPEGAGAWDVLACDGTSGSYTVSDSEDDLTHWMPLPAVPVDA